MGDVDDAGVDYTKWPDPTATPVTGQDLPAPQTTEEKDYIMFVHGWNMAPWEKTAFASTMFKRLWHQGYKGRFGAFRWPTFHGFEGSFDQLTNDRDHFNGSEERAWNSAAPLKSLIASRAAIFNIDGASKLRLYAHSMGNIVCGEALRQFGDSNAPVHTYIAAQAAIESHVYDRSTEPRTLRNRFSIPNVYGYYWQQGASAWPPQWQTDMHPSYMDGKYMPNGVTYINHFNVDDYALNGTRWPLNQTLKPGRDYSFLPTEDGRYIRRRFGEWTPTVLNFPDNRYEIFSHAASSWGSALGKMGGTGGVFSESLDVAPLLVYNPHPEAHKYHSGQFRSTIQRRWIYWKTALNNMKTATPAP